MVKTEREKAIGYARAYISSAPVSRHNLNRGGRYTGVSEKEQKAGIACIDFLEYWRVEGVNNAAKPLVRMVRDVFSVIPHSVGVEGSFSLGRQAVSWRQHQMKADTLHWMIIVRQWRESEIPRHKSKVDTEADKEEKLEKELELQDFNFGLIMQEEVLQNRKELSKYSSNKNSLPGGHIDLVSNGFISDQDERSTPKPSLFELQELTSDEEDPYLDERAPTPQEDTTQVKTIRILQFTRSEGNIRNIKRVDRDLSDTEAADLADDNENISEEDSETDMEECIDEEVNVDIENPLDSDEPQSDDDTRSFGQFDEPEQQQLGFPKVRFSVVVPIRSSRRNQAEGTDSGTNIVVNPVNASKRPRDSLGLSGGIVKKVDGSSNRKGKGKDIGSPACGSGSKSSREKGKGVQPSRGGCRSKK
jgi:hypothetical protein